MNKITTTLEKQDTDCLNIRYIFTFNVPVSKKAIYDNEEIIKVSGVVSWNNGADIKKIQTDLERRYNDLQERLNKEEVINPSVETSWDGSKWL